MKRIATICAILLMATMATAQQKVAILETVDKSGDVSYGVKLLLRSSLTSAISNTPGYEGYDRVDMASIAGEQDFQRTGNVSDSQIKQLGVATGAKYVLVAEAAMYDASSIIITAKILDVETFGVSSSAVLVSGTSADEMQTSCATLASKLLKPVAVAQPTPAPTPQKPAVQQQTAVQQPEVVHVAPQPAPRPKSTSSKRSTWWGVSLNAGMMYCTETYESGYYDYNGTYNYTYNEEPVSAFMFGVGLDMAFSLSNSFGVGPYLTFGMCDEELCWFGGAMGKLTFANDAALLFGLGGGLIMDDFDVQLRLGYKFKSPLYLTAAYTIENGGFVLGFGWSFGGKL